MAQPDLTSMQGKTAIAVAEAFGKYQGHANSLAQVRTSAQTHEFMCNIANAESCLKQYDAFKPTIFALERNIAKKFRDCAKGCRKNAPMLLELQNYKIPNLEEMRQYEAAAKCFSQCVDTVYPDFKRAEQEIRTKRDALQKDFPID